jgi:hypothetical protein
MARPQTQRNDGSTVNSPRIPWGCLKFGKSKWDSDAMGPILFPFPKLPPGSQMGPIKRYAKGTHPSPKFNLPPGGSGRAPSVSRLAQHAPNRLCSVGLATLIDEATHRQFSCNSTQ